MKSKILLGVCIDSESLSLIEADGQKILNSFDIPHSLFEDSQTHLPDDVKLTTLIQKAIRDKKIQAKDVCLSLSNRDVILRSFYIPWMTSAEVKGVVDFESRRYIPFKLEDLSYTFYATNITEQKVRKISILFAAIRKDVLERYSSALKQAGLNLILAEPSSISILRLLTHKKLIQARQRTLLIQIKQRTGSALVIDQGIPRFSRDFPLFSTATSMINNNQDLSEKLVVELRVTLDYFKRQHLFSGDINKILLISRNSIQDVSDTLSKEFAIPSMAQTTRFFIPNLTETDINFINAYGTTLKSNIALPLNLDLSRPTEKQTHSERSIAITTANYQQSLTLGIVCAALIALVMLFSKNSLAPQQKHYSDLKKKEGMYESLTVSDLTKKKDEANNKLESYKNVRIKSFASYFLSRVPQKLPDGVWLGSFGLTYNELTNTPKATSKKNSAVKQPVSYTTKINIELNGYCYTPDPNDEVGRINQLVTNLKEDEKLAKTFTEINLKSVLKQTVDEYTVTSFQISCKQL